MYVHVGGSSSYDSVLDFLILFVFFLKRLVLSVGEGGSDLKVWTIPLVRRVKRYSKVPQSNCRYEPNAGR